MAVLDNPNASTTAPIWNTVLRYGGFSALAMIAYSLLTYLIDFNMMSFSGMAINFILSVGIAVAIAALAIKYQRDNLEGGFISYGRALLIGLIATAIGAFVSGLWNYVLINFIDPGYVDNLKEKFIKTWGESMPAEQLEKALAKFDDAGNLMTNLTNGLIGGVIVGLVAGLIAAAIMKRNRPLE